MAETTHGFSDGCPRPSLSVIGIPTEKRAKNAQRSTKIIISLGQRYFRLMEKRKVCTCRLSIISWLHGI